MVTHETYRRQSGEWIEPKDIELYNEGRTRRARLISTGEPLMVGDVEKMSKSKKNTVAPEEIFEAYGVDAARLFVLSDSPPERDTQWSNAGVEGAWRFVNRVWAEVESQPPEPYGVTGDDGAGDEAAAQAVRRGSHRLVKAMTEAIEGFRFNSGIARLYEFLNLMKEHKAQGAGPALLAARAEALSAFARLIAPFTPHLAEECWARLGKTGLVVEAPWPNFDSALTEDLVVILPVQVNGKRRGEIQAPAGPNRPMWKKWCLTIPRSQGAWRD